MLEINGKIAFSKEKTLYIFDSSAGSDTLAAGDVRTITAYFESLPQDLSAAENKKRLCGMSLDAQMEDSSLCVEYISRGRVISTVKVEAEGSCEKHEKRRLNSPRFNCVSVRLTSSGNGKTKIFSTGVWTK